jgi:hypothetical protein
MPTNAPLIDDPNVKIPGAIKALAAQADEVHKQTYAKDEPAKEPAAEPAKAPETPVTPTSNAPGEPAKEPATPEPTKPGDQNWEHAFKSVNGRYQRAQETIRANASEIANMNTALQQMKARIAELESRGTSSLPTDLALTPKEREDYGEEFLNVVAKQAKLIADEQTKGLRSEVQELKQRLQNVGTKVATNARGEMKKVLSELVPNWKEINENDEFLNWLALRDPFSGAIRHNLLKQAWSANDADRVLAFFRGFQSEASLAPAGSQQDNSQPAGDKPPANNGKIPLENLAAPGRASTAGATSAPAEKPIITSAQIAKFHNDVIRGAYRGREKEKDQMDSAIFEAIREGRVR